MRGGLDRGELVVEGLVRHTQRDLAEELDETAIGVITEARVTGGADLALQGLGIQTQIEDGIHHARHGHGRARAHRYQQWLVGIAETLAGLALQGAHLLVDLLDQPRRQGAVRRGEILEASRGRDHEARRDVQPDLGHLAQIGTLATEQLLVLAVSFLIGKDMFRGLG